MDKTLAQKIMEDGSLTISQVMSNINTTGYWSWNVQDRNRVRFDIGDCYLEEVNGELWWNRPDGSKTCLTGKSNGFKNLYEKLSEDNT